jgi:hypothetical protein
MLFRWLTLMLLMVALLPLLTRGARSNQGFSELCWEQSSMFQNNSALERLILLGQTSFAISSDVVASPIGEYDYESRCIAAGGKYHEVDIHVECSIWPVNGSGGGWYSYDNVNQQNCLGANCTAKEIPYVLSNNRSSFSWGGWSCVASIPTLETPSSDSSAGYIHGTAVLGSIASVIMAGW